MEKLKITIQVWFKIMMFLLASPLAFLFIFINPEIARNYAISLIKFCDEFKDK